jgi:hypothetical protein
MDYYKLYTGLMALMLLLLYTLIITAMAATISDNIIHLSFVSIIAFSTAFIALFFEGL